MEDRERENERISAANRDWSVAVAKSPNSIGSYVVSLIETVGASEVAQFASTMKVDVRQMYLSLGRDTSEHPITSIVDSRDYIGNKVGEESDAIRRLTAHFESYFARRISRLEEILRSADPSDIPAIDAQRAELIAAKQELSRSGIRAYGFACDCSPSQVTELTAKSSARVRIVERDDGRKRPLYPSNKLRDAVIESGGRHGR